MEKVQILHREKGENWTVASLKHGVNYTTKNAVHSNCVAPCNNTNFMRLAY